MTQPLPPPPLKPFQRLQVTDGLLMTADRWRRAHEYHRQRQNVHYQALNQPGIVCGLGVHLIPAPPDVPGKFQDGRWVQIQPGMAIDLAGNLIVVAQPIDFRITTRPANSTSLMVYLVLSYVDPDTLNRPDQQEMLEETFRIDEKNSPPNELEVEICRMSLQPGFSQLEYPTDVFAPAQNQLDFRARVQAQARSQMVVQMAQVVHSDPSCHQRWEQLQSLSAAVSPLYSALQTPPVKQVSLPGGQGTEANQYDLLYLTGKTALTLRESEVVGLKTYLDGGGVLLVDVPIDGADLAKSIMALAQQLGISLEYLDRLDRRHPLRTQPFLFAALPQLSDRPIQLLTGGGIIVVLGDLAAGWGLDEALSHSRETIRSAQELGINLLQFAGKRRSWTKLMGSGRSTAPSAVLQIGSTPLPEMPAPSSTPEPSKSPPPASRNIFDQLLGS